MTLATLPNFGQRITARRKPAGDTEVIIDYFAGFGGASMGIEAGSGHAVFAAVNHSAMAVKCHEANHPGTRHHREDVFGIEPRHVTQGRAVALWWFSPDCTHHSKARGGKPREKGIRALSWVVLRCCYSERPRIVMLENVEEIRSWGPLDDTGQPIRARAGEYFKAFIAALGNGMDAAGLTVTPELLEEVRATLPANVPAESILREGLGYNVEHRELRACDYGAPTIRKRFFLIARRDGKPIIWPEPTHGPGRAKPYRTAAECIDWSIPCPSIFLTAAEAKDYAIATGRRIIRPLATNTLRRIANGVMRFVVNNPKPFIVSVNHAGGDRTRSIHDPLPTITASRRGEAVVAPVIAYAQHGGSVRAADEPLHTVTASNKDQNQVIAPVLIPRYGEREGQAPRSRHVEQPMPVVVPRGNGASLVATFLAQYNTNPNGTVNEGHSLAEPVSTIATRGPHQALTAVNLMHMRGTCKDGQPVDEPSPTITAGGNHLAAVATFLQTYYGNSKDGQSINAPAPTVVTKDRMGLVAVQVEGQPHILVGIGMRMLEPRELLRAQFGRFADAYILVGSKSDQVAGIGNSVCPELAEALVKANVKLERVEAAA